VRMSYQGTPVLQVGIVGDGTSFRTSVLWAVRRMLVCVIPILAILFRVDVRLPFLVDRINLIREKQLCEAPDKPRILMKNIVISH
jgi:hypothetical protein